MAEQLTPRTLDLESRVSNLAHLDVSLDRGFNKFLHKWVLKSNRRVYLPKAQRGVRGSMSGGMLPRKILKF